MGGLAVVFYRDGRPVQRDSVREMLDAVPYRGPDGMFTRIVGDVGLGHAKMAMTPEEDDEVQPVVSPRSGSILICDARLDNRAELLSLLPDKPSRATSDAELILNCYETWGCAAVEHLLGDFAFIIWDPRTRRILAARDTSGQRALFYRCDARTFAAASEIHQLLQDASIPIEPNHARIKEFLVPLNMGSNERDNASTFYKDIHALPAGHLLVVDADNLRVQRYWELRPVPELRYRTDEEYAEHFRALFFDVVGARLRSSKPLGALLSGGLDSSSVVCTTQELYRDGLATNHGFRTFTSTFDGLDCDESDLVADIQTKYGLTAEYVPVRQFGGRLDLEPGGFMEAPNLGVVGEKNRLLSRVHVSGVRALLTGEIADSIVFGSWLSFDSFIRQGNLSGFLRQLAAFRRISTDSLPKIAALYCIAPLLPRTLQQHVVVTYLDRVLRRDADNLVPPWIAKSLGHELLRRHRELYLGPHRERRFASPARQAEYGLLYPPEVGRHPAPWPIEFWRPFADRRLHEFLLAIPPEQKFQPDPEYPDNFYAGSKRILRSAMRGVLPESVRTRRLKTIFGGVVDNEVSRNWSTYESAFGPGAGCEVAAHGYIDQAQFWLRLQQARAESGPGLSPYMMQVVGLETWLRAFKLPRSKLVRVPDAPAPVGDVSVIGEDLRGSAA